MLFNPKSPVRNSLKQIEQTLFDAALSLPDPEEREAFLAYSCNGRPGMRAQIEELLTVHSDAERFFDINVLRAVTGDPSEDANSQSLPRDETEPGPESDNVDEANAWIGRYKLLRCLGDGGSGVVFAAEPIIRGASGTSLLAVFSLWGSRQRSGSVDGGDRAALI